MTASQERVANRGSRAVRLARRLRYPSEALFVGVVVIWAYFLVTNPYGIGPWIFPIFLAEFLFVLQLSWSSSPAWVDVGPDAVTYQPRHRAVRIPRDAIRDIEVHRHWQSSRARNRVPDYWILIRRSNLRGWILYHLRPEAADRLLYLLYQLKKPIMVYS